jgi:hypothetical protein
MLAPVVRLTLYCGLGHSEFAAVVRRVFIDVASDEYGLRGRPANAAKISAKTGISRKSIQKLRTESRAPEWTPDDEVSPVNSVVHYWRFDSKFGSRDGLPKDLPYEGDGGFVDLVRKYAGDIPASTIRQEFLREGLAIVTDDGSLRLVRDFSFPEHLDEDFLRIAAFSIGNHAETLFHNAMCADSEGNPRRLISDSRRLERIAWSRRLNERDCREFEKWVTDQGEAFITDADKFIAHHEFADDEGSSDTFEVAGVGIFFFSGRP